MCFYNYQTSNDPIHRIVRRCQSSLNQYTYIHIYPSHSRATGGLEIRAAYSDHISRQAIQDVIPAAELRAQPHTDTTTTPLGRCSEKRCH